MRAFLSVSDKSGLVDFAKGLRELGVELISTGGTAKALRDAGLDVTGVSDVTGFPECLDGRVKTLHPRIHAGILARRDRPEHMAQIAELEIEPIDLVVVNLYPFKQTIAKPDVTLEEAIENIDIGGPSMLRAAAKNWQGVASIVDVDDYAVVLEELRKKGEVSRETKFRLCAKVFSHTAAYDALIAAYLAPQAGLPEYGDALTLTFEKAQDMRYGENPHQSAAFYRRVGAQPGCLTDAEQLNGKQLSYNNINDTNGALDLLREFQDEIAVVAVKHGNPCGVGVADTVFEAYKKAYEADPVSVFGGIVVTNAPIDAQTAQEMVQIFLEVIVAPAYSDEAVAILHTKQNLRVLRLPSVNHDLVTRQEIKSVAGGLLVQDMDLVLLDGTPICATKRQPTEDEMKNALLAWKVVKHAKSNGIAIAKDGQSLGIGPGQVNRIWAVESAIARSGDKVQRAALASDAYFPFDDCVKAAAKAGIRCVIQPGGSLHDEDSVKACDEAGIAMLYTGIRHFKH